MHLGKTIHAKNSEDGRLSIRCQRNMQSGGEDKELTSYMDQMDEELARTSIGESFEKVSEICPLPTPTGLHEA